MSIVRTDPYGWGSVLTIDTDTPVRTVPVGFDRLGLSRDYSGDRPFDPRGLKSSTRFGKGLLAKLPDCFYRPAVRSRAGVGQGSGWPKIGRRCSR